MKIYEVVGILSPEQRADRQARLTDMVRNGHDELAKYFSTYMNDPGLKTTDSVEYKAKMMLNRSRRSPDQSSGKTPLRKDSLGRTLSHARYHTKPHKTLATTARNVVKDIHRGTGDSKTAKFLSGVSGATTTLGVDLLKKSYDMLKGGNKAQDTDENS